MFTLPFPIFIRGDTVITGFKQPDGSVVIPEEIDITTLVKAADDRWSNNENNRRYNGDIYSS